MSIRHAIVFVLLSLAVMSCAYAAAAAEEPEFGGRECGDCVHRKQRLCADECEDAPNEKVRHCQDRCLQQYCAHKCRAGAPELSLHETQSCDDCLEHEFNSCESHCPAGAARARAVCQIECSNVRCR